MASHDFSYDGSVYLDQDMDAEWNQDTSQYLWDSPQPDPAPALPQQHQPSSKLKDGNLLATAAGNAQEVKMEESGSRTFVKQNQGTHNGLQPASQSALSSASETSSHSSSSTSSGRRRRKVTTGSYAQPGSQLESVQSADDHSEHFKSLRDYGDSFYNYLPSDTNYPSMGSGMDGLSLDVSGNVQTPTFDLDTTMASPTPSPSGVYSESHNRFAEQTVNPMRQTAASTIAPQQMTIQPSKTFFVGPSQENSPESSTLMNSHESSPAPQYGNVYSSLFADPGGLADDFSRNPAAVSGLHASADTRSAKNSRPSTGASTTASAAIPPALAATYAKGAAARESQPPSTSRLSCSLTVDAIPEKSRVETQIPIRLTLRHPPRGVAKLHLPTYAISKPKYQSKPPSTPSPDTLELSAMLVCTSAMQKEGNKERAFQNAAKDIIPLWSDDLQPTIGGGIGGGSGATGNTSSDTTQSDESDAMRPLNGGPVAICPTCINRERKRAARKKTKKVDEEVEWAKDEAKRVIVFNCPEVKEWGLPGAKEPGVQDAPEGADAFVVSIPMRIACYCRHHGEKIGFQVIFSIKTKDGELLAQTICQSIMITDDHKQPLTAGGGPASHFPPKANSQMPNPALFISPQQAQAFTSSFSQPMPFRHSWSTNSLPMLQTYYASQRRPPTFHQETSIDSQPPSQYSTATATPRNLSRPASPSSGEGHSTKKRRSAGASRGKIPSNLAMTRIESVSPNSPETSILSTPSSAGPATTHFPFSPHSNAMTAPFGTVLSQPFTGMPPPGTYTFPSGPSPPALQGPLSGAGFGPQSVEEMYQFYSAPTSQHASRAPSPNSAARISGSSFGASSQVPQQAALALASLPPGINLQKPPIIQRLIPGAGPRNGGTEVTVLGSGFCQGLEVMFGDLAASNTTFWGETTLVCIAPPAATIGKVPVVFQHQHHSGPQALQQLQGLMPTQLLYYEYFDDDRNQLQELVTGVTAQTQGLDPSQLGSSDPSNPFLSSQNQFPDYGGGAGSGRSSQHRPASGGSSNFSRVHDSGFEEALMKWLESLDMMTTWQRPDFEKRLCTGASLLSLASGLGYERFVAGLLARGADPDVRDSGGFTPLSMACLRDQVAVVQRLLLRGADPTVRSLKGYRCTSLAKKPQLFAVVEAFKQTSHDNMVSTNSKHCQRLPYRRKSSAFSLDSISVPSTSSQSRNGYEPGSEITTGRCLFKRTSREKTVYKTTGPKRGCAGYRERDSVAAAWSEQIMLHLQSLQQSMPWHSASSPLALLHLVSAQGLDVDASQNKELPLVRRISEFLSCTPWLHSSSSSASASPSSSPPAYTDIYPSASDAEVKYSAEKLERTESCEAIDAMPGTSAIVGNRKRIVMSGEDIRCSQEQQQRANFGLVVATLRRMLLSEASSLLALVMLGCVFGILLSGGPHLTLTLTRLAGPASSKRDGSSFWTSSSSSWPAASGAWC